MFPNNYSKGYQSLAIVENSTSQSMANFATRWPYGAPVRSLAARKTELVQYKIYFTNILMQMYYSIQKDSRKVFQSKSRLSFINHVILAK